MCVSLIPPAVNGNHYTWMHLYAPRCIHFTSNLFQWLYLPASYLTPSGVLIPYSVVMYHHSGHNLGTLGFIWSRSAGLPWHRKRYPSNNIFHHVLRLRDSANMFTQPLYQITISKLHWSKCYSIMNHRMVAFEEPSLLEPLSGSERINCSIRMKFNIVPHLNVLNLNRF